MAQNSYATVAQLAKRYDTRLLAELGSDSGSDGTVDEDNTILTDAIAQASADVEAYAIRGGRYTLTELSTFQTDENWILIGLVCDLAIKRLYDRRAGATPDSMAEVFRAAGQMLKDLSAGKRVFSVGEWTEAGVVESFVPDAFEREERDLVSDSDFFPKRRDNVV